MKILRKSKLYRFRYIENVFDSKLIPQKNKEKNNLYVKKQG